jgi:hypothetical protein
MRGLNVHGEVEFSGTTTPGEIYSQVAKAACWIDVACEV